MDNFEKYSGSDSTIYHGDCLRALQDIGDASVDLVFADPPYNIGKKFGEFKDSWPSGKDYAEWCYRWLDLCIRKLKPAGSLYVMTSTQAMPYLDLWLRERMTILSRIVWHYDSSGVQAKKYFGSLYEPILFCVKDPKAYTFNASDIEVEAKTGAVRKLIDYRKKVPTPYKTTKIPGNTWYIPRVRYRMSEYEEHPSQKPEALLERIIRASTNPNDLVLDPFGGTFTTCRVAQQLGRRSIGIELQPDYVKIGLRRLGIANHFNGEQLRALDKTYVRKNGNGIRGGATDEKQTGLFDAQLAQQPADTDAVNKHHLNSIPVHHSSLQRTIIMAFTKKVTPAASKKTAATKPAPAAKRAPAKKLTNEQRATLKQFEAPVDFKAAVVEIDFRTAHDGMISPASLIVSRVKGSATNDDAPRLNMFEYDALTASAIVARLSAVVHATNFFKRLPANRRFFVVLRAGKSKDGFLTCSIKSVSILVKKEWVELTRETEQATYLNAFKKIKRAAVPLRGAFVTCQLPPSKRRTKEQADD